MRKAPNVHDRMQEGGELLESLCHLMEDSSPRIRSQAALSIGEHAKDGVVSADAPEGLLLLLGDRCASVRRSATWSASAYADRDQLDPRALPLLAFVLNGKSRAMKALDGTSYGPSTEEVITTKDNAIMEDDQPRRLGQ